MKFFQRAKEVDKYKRRTKTKKERDIILIVCEGEKTEPYYFEGFRLPNVTVKGVGYSTDRLVKEAIKIKKRAKKDKEPYNQVWCVFDRNSFPQQNYNNAFDIARDNDIKVAFSNEAFELWYILHFDYFDVGLSRDRYKEMLSDRLGFNYEKNNSRMYDLLIDLQPKALKFSERLYDLHSRDHHNKKPCTTVHWLVEELNKWLT